MANLDAMGINIPFCWCGRGFCQEVQSVMLLRVAVLGSVGVVNHPEMCRLCAQCWAILEPDLVGWAGKANPLQWEALPELRIQCWENLIVMGMWAGSFYLLVSEDLSPCYPNCSGRVWCKHPPCSCSPVHVVVVVGAERWHLLRAGSPPEGQCVCGRQWPGLFQYQVKKMGL